MQHIGTSKIGKLSAKGITYPQLRLPPEYSDVIGQIADIIETEHRSKRAFLVVPNNSTVLKPSTGVLKTEGENQDNYYLSELKSAIATIQSALLPNEDASLHKKRKNDGPGRIRTGDLR
ncbi:MAG: hypothetical protein ACXVIL_11070, partial [Halobacteriota archaeon]